MLPLLFTVVYLLLPGHPALPFSGVPMGLVELAIVVLVVTLLVWSRTPARSPAIPVTPLAVLCVAAAIKLTIAAAWYPTGWLTRYYANETFAPPVEPSIQPPPAAVVRVAGPATRIDQAIDFRDSAFAVHFFNDGRFAHGARREYTDPFSVEWEGLFESDRMERTLVLEARGSAQVLVDGLQVVALDSPAADGRQREDVKIARGSHRMRVRYSKPANTEAFVRLSQIELGVTRTFDDPAMMPFRPASWRKTIQGLLWAAGVLAHGAALLALVVLLAPQVRARLRDIADRWRTKPADAASALVAPAIMIMAVGYGTAKAWPLATRVWTLPADNDWFALESRARSMLLDTVPTPTAAPGGGSLLESLGYPYLLAAIHRATGETLAGAVQVDHILIGLAAVALFSLARSLVTRART